MNTAKKLTKSDAVAIVMSGNYTQRGTPSCINKFTRAKIAISEGADIVFELPTCYATASSEFFSAGAISLFDSLNCISNISFGTAEKDLTTLEIVANVLCNESKAFKSILKEYCQKGLSFPKARSNALYDYLKLDISKKDFEEILLDSNNILAIEYLKALKKLKSSISPISVLRKGTSYNSLAFNEKEHICSSTAIRNSIEKGDLSVVKDYIPKKSYNILINEIKEQGNIVSLKDFETEILYNLRTASSSELSKILDVEEGLENKIKNELSTSFDIESLVKNINSKRYTQTRIQRILIHSLLGIKTDYLQKYKYTPQYARVLNVSEKGKKILSVMSKTSKIPVVTNVSKFLKTATKEQKEMLEQDILASNIYTLAYKNVSQRKINMDFSMPIF